jgi:hypothetical protein
MPPLLFSLNPSNRGTLSRLKRTRETLSAEITSLINTLAPEIFPDFDATRVIAAADYLNHHNPHTTPVVDQVSPQKMDLCHPLAPE